MRLGDLHSVPLPVIHEAFLEAFSDYLLPMRPSLQALQEMLQRRGFDPRISVGAFEGDRLVGFTLNGRGLFRGEVCGYDSGTGVIPAARRRGLAAEMMQWSIAALRESCSSYVLEVIETNEAARSLYERIGFQVSRRLECFTWNGEPGASQGEATILHRLPDLTVVAGWLDAAPSWQNDFESLRRSGVPQRTFLTTLDHNPAGIAVVSPDQGDVSLLAVDPRYRRRGIGTALLQMMAREARRPLRLLNIDSACESLLRFLKARGAKPLINQQEMILRFR